MCLSSRHRSCGSKGKRKSFSISSRSRYSPTMSKRSYLAFGDSRHLLQRLSDQKESFPEFWSRLCNVDKQSSPEFWSRLCNVDKQSSSILTYFLSRSISL